MIRKPILSVTKQKGWQVVYHADVEILHYGGRSTNQLGILVPRLKMYLSNDYLARKYHGIAGFIVIRTLRMIGFLIRGVTALFYWGIVRNDAIRLRKFLSIYKHGLKIQFLRFPKLEIQKRT